ncbi:EamA family transporter RarD [Altererythrobacter sp. CC-YST694]|uniref:EamA family transporter RarD n=1 Tax=Altererythrobacter sp. CC-YST694 TaxID=2755038 RepID=UPI001D028775|nr:EamA family transporter RarD [Altererythrobacter sp. CC-YST694]MCB5424025.1 EamA family transporter RarD [Altererythrobacter sp. CC-YST694]
MPDESHHHRLDGLAFALGSHAIWGVMPLYLALVHDVPSFEFVAWRIVFTLPLCAAVIAWRGQWGEVRAAFGQRKSVLALLGSSAMIGINWVLYVVAIQTDHVYAASLGYYILPLVMMLLGLVVLKERLSRAQWGAVALATVGVGLLAAGALSTLLFSLTMAVTFGLYGLIRKTVNVGPIAGLMVETLLLIVPAIGVVTWYAAQPAGSSMAQGWGLAAAIVLGGPMTAVPLMLFATAARRMDYTLIGFLQFLSPTIVFLLGLFWFHEELRPAQLGCFVMIWAAMALFVWDLFLRRRRLPRPA